MCTQWDESVPPWQQHLLLPCIDLRAEREQRVTVPRLWLPSRVWVTWLWQLVGLTDWLKRVQLPGAVFTPLTSHMWQSLSSPKTKATSTPHFLLHYGAAFLRTVAGLNGKSFPRVQTNVFLVLLLDKSFGVRRYKKHVPHLNSESWIQTNKTIIFNKTGQHRSLSEGSQMIVCSELYLTSLLLRLQNDMQ